MRSGVVHKVLRRQEWEAAVDAGTYLGSDDDRRDGFIHLSTDEQLAGTVARHFAGQDDLVVVDLDPDTLGDDLRWEPARGGQLFPHLHGPLDPTVAVAVRPHP